MKAAAPRTRPPEGAEIHQAFAELMAIQEGGACEDLLQYRSFIAARQYRHLFELLRAFVPRGGEVLDWGCGNGHFSFVAERLGYRMSGYAFEDFCLRPLLSDFDFVRGSEDSPVALPYADGRFAAVASVGVLEHVRETDGDEEGSLREIRRVLRPGGTFLCVHFPNRYSWIDALSSRTPGKYHHLYRYDRRDIERLCRRSGLEPVEIRRYGVLPRNLSHRFPREVRHSRGCAAAWDALDRLLEYPLSHVCQNYLFVARKPDATEVKG